MESSWRRRVCIWEHLARHLERLAVSHTVGFLPFRLFSDYWLSFSFRCTLIFFAPNCSTFLTHHFDLFMSQIFNSSLFNLFVICFSPGLHHSLTICSFSLLFFYLFFLPLQHISFLHNPHFGKPLTETFRDFQHCADMSWC